MKIKESAKKIARKQRLATRFISQPDLSDPLLQPPGL